MMLRASKRLRKSVSEPSFKDHSRGHSKNVYSSVTSENLSSLTGNETNLDYDSSQSVPFSSLSNTLDSLLSIKETESDSEPMVIDSEWTERCPGRQPKQFIPEKSELNFSKLRSPVDYFRKLFTTELMDLIVEQTNIYGSRKHGRDFKQISAQELEGFIGATFLMSLIQVPSIRDYWSSDSHFGQRQIKSIFHRDRYNAILNCLHLADNDSPSYDRNSPKYDRLHHIRPMVDILNRSFEENYNMGCFCSVDEAMVKFKGRSSIKQYVPNKPTKRGYKLWKICDSVTGYTYQFDVINKSYDL